MIVADPSDPPPDECYLIDADGKSCDIGWYYDPATGYFTTNVAAVDQDTFIVLEFGQYSIDLPPPSNCFWVVLRTGQACGVGWVYDPDTGTFAEPVG